MSRGYDGAWQKKGKKVFEILNAKRVFCPESVLTNLGVSKRTVRFEIWGRSGEGFPQWKAYNMAKEGGINKKRAINTKQIYLHSVVEFVSVRVIWRITNDFVIGLLRILVCLVFLF